jgi:hypothetical protein
MIYIIFAPVSFLSSPKTGGMKDTACLLPLHYRMGRGDLQEGRKKAIIRDDCFSVNLLDILLHATLIKSYSASTPLLSSISQHSNRYSFGSRYIPESVSIKS